MENVVATNLLENGVGDKNENFQIEEEKKSGTGKRFIKMSFLNIKVAKEVFFKSSTMFYLATASDVKSMTCN